MSAKADSLDHHEDHKPNFFVRWFFSTNHVDISIEKISKGTLDTLDPKIDSEKDRIDRSLEPEALADIRNTEEGIITKVIERPDLLDIYDEYDEFTPSDREMRDYQEILDDLYDKNDSDPEWKKKALVEALPTEYDGVTCEPLTYTLFPDELFV